MRRGGCFRISPSLPRKPKGRFAVEAGGRRLRALTSLLDEGKLPPDHEVCCLVLDEGPAAAKEAGLAENFQRQLSRRSDRTKDLYVALIRAIFRKAMREWEWIETMPAFRTYAKGGKVRVRYLTRGQAEALLARLPGHQREVVLFAWATGLRQRNILDLTWNRVDLVRRIATIEGHDMKNGEALGVPLNDIAVAVLERQLGKHERNVFTYRGEPLRSANTRAWHAALRACGIRDFRWHDLRHT